MKASHLFAGLAVLACTAGLPAGKAQATQILVGQCLELRHVGWLDVPALERHAVGPAQLSSLGLGTNQPLVATQTSEYVIRLGITTADFTVSGGPDVIEMLGEYNGNYHARSGPV